MSGVSSGSDLKGMVLRKCAVAQGPEADTEMC